jgi:hypothetical protein
MFARHSRILLFLPVLTSAAVIITGCQTQASLEIRYQQDGPQPAVSAAPASARRPVERPIGMVFRPTRGKLEMLLTNRRQTISVP